MSALTPIISARAARTLLLDAQGLLSDPARRCTAATLGRLIEHMGFVQVDSINVVERAHHLTLASRLDAYRPALLERLLERDRKLFEHWTHDASAIPLQWYPHWHYRFERYRREVRQNKWWHERVGADADRVIAHVRARIKRDGPLRSRDFEHRRSDEALGWWDWKPQKAALEYLWRSGELAVAGRVNFQKVYDLAERVHPEAHARAMPERAAHVDWACMTAMERLIVAMPVELAAFWRAVTVEEAREWCANAVRDGRAVKVLVEHADGMKPHAAYAMPDWKRRLYRAPPPPDRARLLSPFDPVLRDRRRAMRLFNFDYRFEAFTPAQKRRYGYYTMPILDGDDLVGRVDPKHDRRENRLVIRKIWWEPGVRATRMRRRRLEAAIVRLAEQIGAGDAVVTIE